MHKAGVLKHVKEIISKVSKNVNTVCFHLLLTKFFILQKEIILNGALSETKPSCSYSVTTTLTAPRHAKSAACLIRADL